MSIPSNDEYEKIMNMKKEVDNERVTDIFIQTDSKNELKLVLSTGLTESVVFNEKEMAVELSNSAMTILTNFVKKEKSHLIKYANEYQIAGRQFYNFLYDLVALVKYLDELPQKFLKLLKIEGSADTFMHKRIQAEMAVKYIKKGLDVDLEIKNKKGKKMDLIINSVETEIKTIISPSENSKDSCTKFANKISEKYNEAQVQFETKGILCVAPWSLVMNNILKEYYAGLYSTELPEIKKDKSVLIISGERAFEDYCLEFDSNKIIDSVNFFANIGVEHTHPMAYLEYIMRWGFPSSRGGTPRDFSKTGMFYFKVG